MERGFNKIVIVSLCENFARNVGKLLAQELDMLFCDCKELLEYELIDADAIKKFCTVEYLEMSENRVFQQISDFENVVLTIDYDNLMHHIESLKQKSMIVFLKATKALVKAEGEKINAISWGSRTKQLEEFANLTIDINKIDEKKMCEEIIYALGGIL